MAQAQTIGEERQALARAKAQALIASERASKLEAQAAKEATQAESAQMQAAAVAARIQSAEADMSAAESRIRLIAKLQEEQRKRLAQKQEPVVRLVAALQSLSRRPPALALVQPGSVSDLAHVRAVLSGMAPVLKTRTAELRAELARSRGLRSDAEKALAVLQTSRERLAADRAELVALSQRHRVLFEQINANALTEQDRAIGFGEKARDISALMSDLDAESKRRDRLAQLSGPVLRPSSGGVADTLPVVAAGSDTAPARNIPYRLPVTGSLVSGLGEATGAGTRAKGLTLATRADAIVLAPSAGRIAFAGEFKGYGRIIIIDHGNQWTSLITSLAGLDVRVGDTVMQGSPIGKTATGDARVTVELRHAGQPVDIASLVG